jgi:hypothetical protein
VSLSVLYWSLIVVTYLAGVGTPGIIQWFRQPHPGTRVRAEAEAGRPAPVAAAEPAPPRTVHHDYDTMDVLAAGWAAREDHGLHALRACGAAPGGTSAPADWRCVKPAGHLYLHETGTGGSWDDNTFEPPGPPWPASNDDSAGWVSGSTGGAAGTWQPR